MPPRNVNRSTLTDGELALTHESYSGSTFNTLGVAGDGVTTVTLESIGLIPTDRISIIQVGSNTAHHCLLVSMVYDVVTIESTDAPFRSWQEGAGGVIDSSIPTYVRSSVYMGVEQGAASYKLVSKPNHFLQHQRWRTCCRVGRTSRLLGSREQTRSLCFFPLIACVAPVC